MLLGLELVVWIMWVVAYIAIIRQGFADRTYGMPIVALASNISWEFIFAFIRPTTQPQETADIVWFVLDLVILTTVVHFGPKEFPDLPKRLFVPALAAIITLAFLATLFVSADLDASRPILTAFAGNLMMSALFLNMLYGRWRNRSKLLSPLRGQSMIVAWAKLTGTACASIAAYVYFVQENGRSALLLLLYIGCFLLDVVYVAALHVVKRSLIRSSDT
jgi:hypothetical protein